MSELINKEVASTELETVPQAKHGQAAREPPPYVRSLSTDERAEAERALVRKIDLRLMPALIVMYLLNYIDRNNIASARLAGLEDDLGLKGTQYQTSKFLLKCSIADSVHGVS